MSVSKHYADARMVAACRGVPGDYGDAECVDFTVKARFNKEPREGPLSTYALQRPLMLNAAILVRSPFAGALHGPCAGGRVLRLAVVLPRRP
jgi:hypothetical protein